MIRLTLILSFICSTMFAQQIVIVDQNTGKQYRKDLSDIVDTTQTKVIHNLSDNYQVYKVLRKPRPEYNYLEEKLVPVETFTDSIGFDEFYPYVIRDWNVVRLSDQEIIQRKELAILEKEMSLLINNISQDEINQYLVMAVAALLYERDGVNLNSQHEEVLTIVKERGLKIFQNRQNKKQLLQDLQTNPDININQNWNE